MSRYCFIALLSLAAIACPALGQNKTEAPAKAKPRTGAPKQAPQPDAIPGYKILNIEGFTVVVSDETHMFRIHEICAANGLDVLTSPRSRVTIENQSSEMEIFVHEILSYTAWRLHMEGTPALILAN